MSESTGAPQGEAAAPTPDSGPAISGPAADQPALSVSEAARLLNRQRREQGQAPMVPLQRTAPPANGEVQARNGPAPQQADAPRSTAADAMAKALGINVDAQAADGAPAAPTGIDFDGRRYAPDELRALIREGGDYTKKTQALAEQSRQVQAQAEALARVLPIIQPEIQRLTAALQDVPTPDEALIEVNPQEYMRQRHRWEAALHEQQRLAQLGQLQQEAQGRAMAQRVEAANQELAREFPQWGDPKERAAWQQEIVDWALDKGGYTRDELRGLTDAKHLRTMMKAMALDRWVGGTRTAAPQSMAAPVRGTAPPPAPTAQVQAAEAAFEARPSIRSGAALLAARRGNGLAR